jgi:hypothetical protein
MEMPFVFGNINRYKEIIGGGKSTFTLMDKVRNAGINFAKTINRLVYPYDRPTPLMMVLNHPDTELLKIVDTK